MLKVRNCCPICSNSINESIISIPLNDPVIVNYQKLERFFSDTFLTKYPSEIFSEFNFRIQFCKECEFYFNSNVLNDEGMSLLYNEWLDQTKLSTYYSCMSPNINEKCRLDIMEKYFKKKINVLDFGAGYGNFLKLAKANKFNLFAFDLSINKNVYLENELGVKLIGDLMKYKNYFHLFNLNQVLEHIADPLNLVIDLKNCLTEDGILFISTPNCINTGQLLRENKFDDKLWEQLTPFQHINAFNNKSLRLIGKNADWPLTTF